MRRLKTKRVLWTIAALLALSLVGVLVFHKQDEPKIIGNISPKDVSEISKDVYSLGRSRFESEVDFDLVHLDLRQLLHSTRDYLRFKITTIAVYTNGHVLVGVETGVNEIPLGLDLIKEGDRWVIAARARPKVVPIYKSVITNTAPVSQGGVVR